VVVEVVVVATEACCVARFLGFFNERMSKSTAESVSNTTLAEDSKHQKKNKKEEEEKEEKGGMRDETRWMKRGRERKEEARVGEENGKRSEEFGTWPDWAIEVTDLEL